MAHYSHAGYALAILVTSYGHHHIFDIYSSKKNHQRHAYGST